MPNATSYIKWIKDLDMEDAFIVGSSFAKLGELSRQGFNVSEGFIVLPLAYSDLLKEENLYTKIKHLF